MLLSTVSGAVFAILLALIFLGGLIDGALFPQFAPSRAGQDSNVKFGEFLNGIQVNSGIDGAKMLVWAFIAGFAEQFVPDVLNRIVNTNVNTK